MLLKGYDVFPRLMSLELQRNVLAGGLDVLSIDVCEFRTNEYVTGVW